MSYFFHVGGLVQDLHDLLGELVVGLGPDASSLVSFDHFTALFVLSSARNKIN